MKEKERKGGNEVDSKRNETKEKRKLVIRTKKRSKDKNYGGRNECQEERRKHPERKRD